MKFNVNYKFHAYLSTIKLIPMFHTKSIIYLKFAAYIICLRKTNPNNYLINNKVNWHP